MLSPFRATRFGIKTRLVVLAFFVCLACLSSCDVVQPFFCHSLVVAMPPTPEAWRGMPSLTYEVLWSDEFGETRSAYTGPGDEVRIKVRRGQRQVVIAYPLFRGERLRPAGALYPFDVEALSGRFPSSRPDVLRLGFSSGYSAETALCLEKSGHDPWAYPLERLHHAWEDKGVDPWLVSPARIAEALADGVFRVSLFSLSTESVTLPSDSLWWPESPLAKIESSEYAQTAALAEGVSIFYGMEEALKIRVEGNCVLMQRTTHSE